MTPRQQLIPRFFDDEAKKRMSADMFKNTRLRQTDLYTLNSINSVNFVDAAHGGDTDNTAAAFNKANNNNNDNNSYNQYDNYDDNDRKILNEFDEGSYAVADSPHHRPIVQEAGDDGESAIFDLNFDEIFNNTKKKK